MRNGNELPTVAEQSALAGSGSEIVLRPYQVEAVANVRAAYARGHRAVLLVLPTGAGKTVAFSYIAGAAAQRGNSVLILVHRRELLRQASAKLTLAGVEHGCIAPGFEETTHRVQVASIATLVRRLDRMPKYGLIIIDEAHHSVSATYTKLLDGQGASKILGVTATPERLDGKGLGTEHGGVFDEMVLGPTVQDLIDGGHLTPSRVFAPSRGPDLSGVRTHMGDYVASDLAQRMGTREVIGDAVVHYQRHASGIATIAFCATVAHAERVAQAFREAGYRAICVHGGTSVKDRDAAIAGLATGDVQVITSCDVISEGVDIPNIGCICLLRPTKSLGLHMQQVGRGLRPAPGKTHLVVLDHAANTLRSGLPEEPRAWSLGGHAKDERESPAPATCPQCHALHHPGPCCPHCGFEYEGTEQTREVEEREGILSEITLDERRERLRNLPLRSILTGKESREQLEEIRMLRGYKAGWVFHTLRTRQDASAGRA